MYNSHMNTIRPHMCTHVYTHAHTFLESAYMRDTHNMLVMLNLRVTCTVQGIGEQVYTEAEIL